SLAHSPLFQTMFAWQNTPRGRLGLQGLKIEPLKSAAHVVSRFDLTLSLQEAGDRIVGGVECATSLFERGTVARYLGYFRSLLEAMVAEGGETQTIDRLPLLSTEERNQLLYEWNETDAEYPGEQCIHELFEEQVRKTPQAVALMCGAATLGYEDLNRRANRLARYLRDLGVKPDTRVAICVERGLEMVVGLFGVLKAGGAYVPLDPAYPAERLRYMLADSAPEALITQGKLTDLFNGLCEDLPVIDLDAIAIGQEYPETNLDRAGLQLTSRHLAYVIYTSGSTGIPKGVAIEHRNAVNFITWARGSFSREDLERTLFS